MNAEQLLQELKIRFNTDPKRYEKQDFVVLIKLLAELIEENKTIQSRLTELTSEE